MRAAAALAALLLSALPSMALQAPMPSAAPRIAQPALDLTGAEALSSTLPEPRPPAAPRRRIETGALAASLPQTATGALCGDRRLTGARIAAIDGPGACGIAQPVRVAKVAGVRLDPPATVTCETARALADWVSATVAPTAARTLGAQLTGLKVAASYSCRPRNNRPGARLSEHSTGRAVDISGFALSDGRVVTVLDGWRGSGRGFLKASWSGACGPFGTVLGPDSDAYHKNHFHFDVARYRSGAYCR